VSRGSVGAVPAGVRSDERCAGGCASAQGSLQGWWHASERRSPGGSSAWPPLQRCRLASARQCASTDALCRYGWCACHRACKRRALRGSQFCEDQFRQPCGGWDLGGAAPRYEAEALGLDVAPRPGWVGRRCAGGSYRNRTGTLLVLCSNTSCWPTLPPATSTTGVRRGHRRHRVRNTGATSCEIHASILHCALCSAGLSRQLLRDAATASSALFPLSRLFGFLVYQLLSSSSAGIIAAAIAENPVCRGTVSSSWHPGRAAFGLAWLFSHRCLTTLSILEAVEGPASRTG